AATLNGGTLNGLVGSETLTVGGLTGVFDNQNVGTGKTVSISGVTLGDGTGLASNYAVSNPSSVTAAITAKALTLTGVSANGKVYDGNTAATLSGGTLIGLVGGETLAVTGLSGAFADKNVGTGKTVSLNGASLVDGTGLASNYSLGNPSDTSASIIAKALTVTGIGADNKVYDATTAAALNLSGVGFAGLVSGDDVSLLSANGAFSDKNAASGKTVIIDAISLGGSDIGNYQWNNSTTTTADISKAALTVTVGDSRKPQGQNNPAFIATYQGLLGSDSVAADLSGDLAFSTQATPSSSSGQYRVSASGQSASNYDIAYTDGLLTVDAALRAPLGSVVETVQPLRNLPKPTPAAAAARPQLPSGLYTLVDQGLRLPEGL
ncbi:YDG domain-containing protein, partial [Pseudomonas sp. Marseille-Q1929]|uniref:YDG domain-containing protein n=1 Tax=Pseudomonas sp. Marseille-Q1929 TaxID=2730402 RepID=UPI001AC1788F